VDLHIGCMILWNGLVDNRSWHLSLYGLIDNHRTPPFCLFQKKPKEKHSIIRYYTTVCFANSMPFFMSINVIHKCAWAIA